MKKKLMLLLLCALPLFSQGKAVSFGIFIDNFFEINWHDNTATLSFTVWNVYDHPVENPEKGFSISNAVTEEIISTNVDKIADNAWVASVKYKAKLYQHYNVEHFPFAQEKVEIEVVSNDPIGQVNYELDKENSMIAPDARVANWRIRSFDIDSSNSKFGFSLANVDTSRTNIYERVLATVTLDRGGWKLFGGMFMVTYIAFFLASIIFFIRNADFSARTNLVLAALFAAVGNKITLDAYLPLTDYFSLTDWIQTTTFVYIALVIFACIFNTAKTEEDKPRVMRIDMILGAIFVIAYIIVNVALVTNAISAGAQA